MNTPAHVIASALVLGRGSARAHWAALSFGALLPDLPMLVFYVRERWMNGEPEAALWARLYFDPEWQDFFDLFNSLPLIALCAGFAWVLRSRAGLVLFLSMALHSVADFALHHDDAHRHFYPLSNWRFVSPVSYWDPAHHGGITGPLEAALAVAGSIALIRRPERGWRAVGITVLALYALVAVLALAYFALG